MSEKFVPTKASKVQDDKEKMLDEQRWRVLKVQAFEDGILARVLTQGQCSAEKEALASLHTIWHTSVLVGDGHAGVGEELMWRHIMCRGAKTGNDRHILDHSVDSMPAHIGCAEKAPSFMRVSCGVCSNTADGQNPA